MKKITFIITALIFAFSLNSTAQKVTIDLDKDADFSKYKSFVFDGWQEDIDEILNESDKKNIKDAYRAEMKKRNLEKVTSNGDMLISLFVVVDKKSRAQSYNDHYGISGASDARNYKTSGGGYGSSNQPTSKYKEYDYLEGTMVLNVFDAEAEKLVWQVVASQTINEKPEKRSKSIPKAVKKIMKKFPIEPVK